MIMHEDTKCLFDLRTCCAWFVLGSKYLTDFNWNTWTSICFHCKKFISVFESAITTNPRIVDRRTHTFCTLFDRAFPLLVLPVVCTMYVLTHAVPQKCGFSLSAWRFMVGAPETWHWLLIRPCPIFFCRHLFFCAWQASLYNSTHLVVSTFFTLNFWVKSFLKKVSVLESLGWIVLWIDGIFLV